MSLCVKCAQHERTCCQVGEVLITDGDIQRIAAHTRRSDFWSYVVPADPDLVQPQPHDPNWLPYTLRPNGTRAHLHRQTSGDCTFLTAAGCSLPTAVRPLICRLYPFDYTEQGITGTVSGCPLYLLEKGQTLIEGIGMKPADAERWRQQLYHELRTGRVYDENRHRALSQMTPNEASQVPEIT